jgi:hypothetical protein
VIQAMLICAVVLVFGLAHVRLRVQLGEVRREVGSLQADQSRFIAEINTVRTRNEALKNPRNLAAYAVSDLGMVPYDPANRQAIAMPESIQTRYALARATGGEQPAGVEVAGGERTTPILASLGERIGLVADAQADQPAR